MDHKKIYFNLVTAMLATTAIVACTEKRSEYFAQGQGKNLFKISDFEGKRDTLATTKFKTKNSENLKAQVSAANELIVGKTKYLNNIVNIVDYTTTSKLLESYTNSSGEKALEIVGKENESYPLKYEFTAKNILVRKIVPESHIPIYEKRAGKIVGKTKNDRGEEENLYSVILIGCPITYIDVANQLNRNQEKTKQLVELTVKTKEESNHFKVDEKRCREFSYAAVTDVFESSLFEGEWYFAETIVKTEDKWNALVGWEVAQDFRSRKAQKIKFVKYENSILAINQNVDERVQDKDINKNTVMSMPVRSWYDFAIDPTDDLKEITNTNRFWKQRPYVALAVKEAYSPAFSYSIDGAAVIAVEVDKDVDGNDYFALTLQKPMPGQETNQMVVKYAFLKTTNKRTYEPRNYFKEDEKIFGFFASLREVISNHQNDRKGDIDRYTHISRFDPKKKLLTFRFSDISVHDVKVRALAAKAVKSWEDAFRMAGIPMKFELKTDIKDDVSLGDIRYNIINIIESVSTGSLIGVGPSIVDPFTGEIISATANIQLTSIRGIYTRFLRNYIRSQLGVYKGNYLCIKDRRIYSEKGVDFTTDDKECNTFETIAANLVARVKANPTKCSGVDAVVTKYKEQITSYEDLLVKQSLWDSAGELAAIEPCVESLSESMLVSSLVHELGHNLGLRHNFRGSTDARNYWSDKKTNGIKVETAAVMDYLSPFANELEMPGKYEVAAILYGYAGKILPRDAFNGDNLDLSKAVAFDTTKSLRANFDFNKIKISYDSMHPFSYCSDEDINEAYRLDPMCLQFDSGSTPLDVVNHLIKRYEMDYLMSNHKFDKQFSVDGRVLAGSVDSGRTADYFWRLKDFYDTWRITIASQYSGDKFFEKYKTVDSYSSDLKTWMDEDNKGRFADKGFSAAAVRSFDFFKQLYFKPDRHCVGKKGERFELVKLNDIRNRIRSEKAGSGLSRDEFIVSCSSPLAQNHLKESGYESVKTSSGKHSYSISEIGLEKSDVIFNVARAVDLQTSHGKDAVYDVIGLNWDLDRLIPDTLLLREVRNQIQLMKNFHPHYLDEPTNRKQFLYGALDRLVFGIILDIQKDSGGAYLVKVLDSMPDEVDRTQDLPGNILTFPEVMGDKEKALNELTGLIRGAYTISSIVDRYHGSTAGRMTRNSEAIESEMTVLAIPAADPHAVQFKVKTSTDRDETTVYGVPPRFQDPYLANLTIGLHAKIRREYGELEKIPAKQRTTEQQNQIALLRTKGSILETVFKSFATGPNAGR